MRFRLFAVAVALTASAACSTPTTPAERCDAGFGDACFQAAIEATDAKERSRFMNLGGGYGDPYCKNNAIRDDMAAPWGEFGPKDRNMALHAFSATCHQGHPAACFELGNWLMFDYVSPAAAVAPYTVACKANLAQACTRADIASDLTKAPPTNKPPPSSWK